eukprot:scaffold79445_cov48-Cyclotella_meneghiniana.AAC.4
MITLAKARVDPMMPPMTMKVRGIITTTPLPGLGTTLGMIPHRLRLPVMDPDDEDDEDEESDHESDELSRVDDPMPDVNDYDRQKYYWPRGSKAKKVARMLMSFCKLPPEDANANANAIVCYFRVDSMDALADFRAEYWDKTISMWTKPHFNKDGTKRSMIILPPTEARIKCAAWACRHQRRLEWPGCAFAPLTCSKKSILSRFAHRWNRRSRVESPLPTSPTWIRSPL